MPATKLIITLPILPPSLNDYRLMHWSKQHKLKKQWEREFFVIWNKLGRPTFPKISIALAFTFPDQRKRDLDNYIATGSKFVGDAVKGLFIQDDNPDFLTGWSFRFDAGKVSQTKIVITPGNEATDIISGREISQNLPGRLKKEGVGSPNGRGKGSKQLKTDLNESETGEAWK
jgi:hypothetical protein